MKYKSDVNVRSKNFNNLLKFFYVRIDLSLKSNINIFSSFLKIHRSGTNKCINFEVIQK